MTKEPDGQNERVRRELIGHRVFFAPLEIRLHHVYDDDTDDFQVWARMIRLDGTEAFAVISREDAQVCKAVWGKAVIWMTALKPKKARRHTSPGAVEEEMIADRIAKLN